MARLLVDPNWVLPHWDFLSSFAGAAAPPGLNCLHYFLSIFHIGNLIFHSKKFFSSPLELRVAEKALLLSGVKPRPPKAGARVSIRDPDSFAMLTRMGIQWSRTEMEFQGRPVFSTDQETNLPLFSNNARNKASGLCRYAVNMINAANSGTAAGTKQLHGVPEDLLSDVLAPSPVARSSSKQAASHKTSSRGRKSTSEDSSCDGPWGAAL